MAGYVIPIRFLRLQHAGRLFSYPVLRVKMVMKRQRKTSVTRIDRDPDICGGEPRIAGTRISIWLLVQARKLGTSEAEILQAYPTLRTEDLAAAWSYYGAHRDEIEHQILENEAV